MGDPIMGAAWYPWAINEFGEVLVLELLNPQRSESVKNIYAWCDTTVIPAIANMIVECTLPLDVETAIGLQIVGQRAETDPGLELTILVSLEENDDAQ